MKKYIKNITIYNLILLCATALFISCDNTSYPYREAPTSYTQTSDTVRKVMIESFTGFKCGNCPDADTLLQNLKAKYKGVLYPVIIHAGSDAIPNKSGHYTYDFRTAVGTAIFNEFNVQGTPAGLINRYVFNDNYITGSGFWEQYFKTFLTMKPDMMINLNASYDASLKQINISADIDYLTTGLSTNHLSVFILEDSIIQYQTWYGHTPEDDPNFVHNDVLRASINGTWGEQLSSTAISSGKTFSKSFSYVIPTDSTGATLWNPNHVKVIAFVHNRTGSDYEVLQVEEKNIK